MKWPNKAPVTRRIPVANPAPGVDFSRTNDSGGTWLIRGLVFVLATSVAAATRTVALRAVGAETVWWQTSDGFGQVANTTIQRFAFQGSQPIGSAGSALAFAWPHEGLLLPNGHVFSSLTGSIQAADQYSGIVLDVLEFPETYPDWLMPMTNVYGYSWVGQDNT